MNLIETFLNGNVENNIDTITSDDRIFLKGNKSSCFGVEKNYHKQIIQSFMHGGF